MRKLYPCIFLDNVSVFYKLGGLNFVPGICHSKSGFPRLSCLGHSSIVTVTNVIHDPFQCVDRPGLAISQFGPGFLGSAYFVLG
jgi:hypothetical protein